MFQTNTEGSMIERITFGMTPHNMTSFKFICVLYQFHRQTLLIKKIERDQIQFREGVTTGTGPLFLWTPGSVPSGTCIFSIN